MVEIIDSSADDSVLVRLDIADIADAEAAVHYSKTRHSILGKLAGLLLLFTTEVLLIVPMLLQRARCCATSTLRVSI